jgi:molybdopterin-containing oxidoreductase family membrane subunit
MDAWSIVGFIQSGLLWIATGVSLLWIFRRIEDAAAVRLLGPVLILQAVGALIVGYIIGMELFVAHYSGAIYTAEAMHIRLNGPYWWAYWLRIAAGLAPVAFLIPKVRRSMPVVAGISLVCFTVMFSGTLIGMVAWARP